MGAGGASGRSEVGKVDGAVDGDSEVCIPVRCSGCSRQNQHMQDFLGCGICAMNVNGAFTFGRSMAGTSPKARQRWQRYTRRCGRAVFPAGTVT
jgi:hypothetical protein